jgi:hypothetical protein
MGWVIDLLKHLAISRSIIAASFVTTIVMVFGPKFLPTIVPAIPQPWLPLLFGIMILTGTLLAFWIIAIVWGGILSSFRVFKSIIPGPTLNIKHYELLLELGRDPSEPMNIDNVDYESAPFSKLEIMQWISELEKNGLVKKNPWNESLISLTSAGRDRAFEIQRS